MVFLDMMSFSLVGQPEGECDRYVGNKQVKNVFEEHVLCQNTAIYSYFCNLILLNSQFSTHSRNKIKKKRC
jgi:hypothetical protein